MEKLLKHIVCIFILACICFIANAETKDSLLNVIKGMPRDTMRLSFIHEQVNNSYGNKDSFWASMLLREASAQKNMVYEGYAYFALIKFYYTDDMDSMKYYLELAEPVFLKNMMIESLFRTKAWYAYRLVDAGQREETLSWIKALRQQADQLDYAEGKDMADQALANFYIKNNLRAEGVRLYEEILAEMEKREAPLVKRANILRQLIRVPEKTEDRLKYLEVFRAFIDKCKKKGLDKLDVENPIYSLEFMYYRSHAFELLQLYNKKKTGDLNVISTSLQKAADLVDAYNMKGQQIILMQIYASYYQAIKQYDRSILLYDSLARLYQERGQMVTASDQLHSKALVLYEAERFREAADWFAYEGALKDSINSSVYYNTLAGMKNQHETDKLELRNKEMELDAMRARNAMIYLGGGLFVLILVCGLLMYWVHVVRRFSNELKTAKERAEETDRLKSAFLANMNHEIRTPLNAIVGFSQVLVEENDPVARQEYADIIANNNDLLQRLICDVLDISKVESNTIEFTYSDVDMPAMMREIYSVMSLRIPAGVELRMDSCPAFIFHTDRNRLTQILTNFLTNASKHTEKGYICFGYEFIETGQIRFYVKDSGEGIPEEQLDRIFTRFVKLTEWTKGVGLGLAISKALVTHLGGHIEVESKVGVGSTFSVIFPINK